MGNLDLAFAFAVALTLGTTQCSRAPDAEDFAPSRAPAPVRVPNDVPSAVRVPIDGLPAFGSPRALVTIVSFTDYECPYCAKADKTIAALRSELGDEVRVVLATRPLAMHEHAAPAARALLAAAEQGKAEAMHVRLFADRTALDDAGLAESARAIGLDSRAFERARNGPSTADALARVEALATSLDVNGTPTFFVNGRRMVGARTYDVFRALVDEERARAQALVAAGLAREQVYASLIRS